VCVCVCVCVHTDSFSSEAVVDVFGTHGQQMKRRHTRTRDDLSTSDWQKHCLPVEKTRGAHAYMTFTVYFSAD